MANNYLLIIEYKIKLKSNVTYRKKYFFVDKTIDFVEEKEEAILNAFILIGFYPYCSEIRNNDNTLISAKDYIYHA